MNTKELMKKVDNIEEELKNVDSIDKLNEIKVEYTGKKGVITTLLSSMKDLSNEEKKEFGAKINVLKTKVNDALDKKIKELNEIELNKKLESEKIDITLPSTKLFTGSQWDMML